MYTRLTATWSHLCYSLAVVLSCSHVSCCQVIAGPQDGGSHSKVHPCLRLLLLRVRRGFAEVMPFRREAVKPSDCGSTKKKQQFIQQC